MTQHQKMQELLNKCGIPAKEIQCYGSQIVVTCWSRDAADRFATLLAKFAKVRGIVETADYNKVDKGTRLTPTRHKVWRTFAAIQ